METRKVKFRLVETQHRDVERGNLVWRIQVFENDDWVSYGPAEYYTDYYQAADYFKRITESIGSVKVLKVREIEIGVTDFGNYVQL